MKQFKIKYLTTDSELIRKVDNFISDWFDPALWIETNTSGSTGAPKTILLEKAKMRVSATMTGKYFDFAPGQRIMLCLSPDSIGGKMLITRAILHDMELIVAPLQRNPLEGTDSMIDFAAMVPMQVQAVLDTDPSKLELIRNLLIGGATVTPALREALSGLKVNCYESFGMTETMSHIAIRKLDKQPTPFEGLDGVHFSLKDEKLVIHAPKLGLPVLETNDIVELIDEKRFSWKGRADFAINSGGLKFHPELIEQKLSGAFSNRFFITSAKDVTLGEKIILVLEASPDEFSEEKISKIFSARLTGYEIPKKTYFVPEFCETISGKVNRTETKKRLPL